MGNFVETTINNYSGLSSDTKPTISAGNNVPNGSRWREIDTGKTFHFNIHDDYWYETEEYIRSISGASPTVDVRSIDIAEQILLTLKKIEYHLAIATDTNLED